MVDLKMLAEAVIRGDAKECARLTQEGLDNGLSPQVLLNDGLMAGMAVIGERFKCNDIYVPEVLIAARAMKAGMVILRPKLAETGAKPVGKVVAGTVKGDLHDIGKNIVCMMLEGAGFQVTDLGNDVAPERFIQAIKEQEAQIVGMSALLTTTMLNMKGTIEALKAAGLREKVRVMVGGAPVTQRFAEEIGADGYAENAAVAVEKAKELLAVH
ncbi:MAG: corrinoid protein [candidate division NC10 bacterium]|nr:corrinoid protein [candidate division NC10 bacterium]